MLLLAPASVFYLAQTRPLKEASCFARGKLSRPSFQAYDALLVFIFGGQSRLSMTQKLAPY